MTIKNFNDILLHIKNSPPIKLAIALPHNEHVLESIFIATKEKLILPYIAGNKNLIEGIAKKHNLDLSLFNIKDLGDKESIDYTIELVRNNECQLLMKGDQSTASIMSPVLKKENNLKKSKILSHIYLLELPTYHKLLFVTDGALNISPNKGALVCILENAISLANRLKVNCPKVAVLSAVEVPTDKMPSTLLAKDIANDLRLKQKAIIEGPIAFDGAINKSASLIKHMQSEISGDIDIALVPSIEAGNMLAKSLIYLANAKAAGIILGAKIPIILTSRSDSTETKVLSIALASLYINGGNNV